MGRKNKIDIVNGPMIPNIIRYILPLIASGVLQLLYATADNVVIGRFDGPLSLGAIGSTVSVVNLLLTLCMGLSVGSSVCVSQYYGAKDISGVHKVIHTSVFISLLGGILFGSVGFFFSEQFLLWMNTPADILPLAATYLRIFFLGTPASMVYNFCAAILQATGDTKHPTIYLTISGILNVILNLIFVIFFHMSVAGVALATILSQYVSAILIIIHMVRLKDGCHLDLRKLKIYKNNMFRIIRIGLPAGLQSSLFSVANVVIQVALNSFDNPILMAGSTAAGQTESFIYTVMSAVHYAAITFTGQNLGAGKIHKLPKILLSCLLIVVLIGVGCGIFALIFANPLLEIYIKDEPAAIVYGIERLRIIGTTAFIYGCMEILVGCLRGMGASLAPTIVSMFGICGVRILWITFVFYAAPSLTTLFLAYPVSNLVTALAHSVFYWCMYRKLRSTPSPLPLSGGEPNC